MEQFFKATAITMLAIVIVQILKPGERAIAQLLSLLVCALVLTCAVQLAEPIVSFVRAVREMSGLDEQMLTRLLKTVGISATAEVASLLCNDSGNSAMGKALQFLATAVILCLSLPMLTALLELIEGIVNKL